MFPAHWWRRTLFVPYEGGVEWEVSYTGRNSRVSGWYSVPARAICTVRAAFFFKQSARALHLFANSLTLLTQRACVHVCVCSFCNNDHFEFLTSRWGHLCSASDLYCWLSPCYRTGFIVIIRLMLKDALWSYSSWWHCISCSNCFMNAG